MKISLSSTVVAISLALFSVSAADATVGQPRVGRYVARPSRFTSGLYAHATPGAVIAANGSAVAGQPGAVGRFSIYLNSDHETICWDISLEGVTDSYESGARTGTHIHQALAGAYGPPRVALPNPTFFEFLAGEEIRNSKGCIQGPFTTGVNTSDATINSTDTGSASGFRVRDLENNPGLFYADVHTTAYPEGAVRGQFLPSERPVAAPRRFTSILRTTARPERVVSPTNTTNSLPGQPDAIGNVELRINTDLNILCYHIELSGVTGDYLSPAKTATHIHQAPRGLVGPPRIALKNPLPATNSRRVKRFADACVKGPFTTGILGADGRDTGSDSGFDLRQLENDPGAFFFDTHTETYPAGVVRGQFRRIQ
ncbi:hypothetical protein ACQY0O_000948 [Thecaphora frezii]